MTPPLRSAAVFTPGAAKKVKRITLLKEPMSRMSPPPRLTRTTEDKPDMHEVEPAGLEFGRAAAAAVHIDDVDLETLRGIEAGIARHYQASTVLTASEMPALNSIGSCAAADPHPARVIARTVAEMRVRAKGLLSACCFLQVFLCLSCFLDAEHPSGARRDRAHGRHPIPAASIVAVNRRFGRCMNSPPLSPDVLVPHDRPRGRNSKLPEQPPESFDPVVDAAAPQRIPDDRLVRASSR